MGSNVNAVHREPWNKGKIVGQKAPFMKFRPYPHLVGQRAQVMQLELPPRSLYVIEEDARWH